MIALHQLEKVFHVGEGGVAALRGVHLQMDREEFFVLLGPSGSGKTTLLRCVAGGYVFGLKAVTVDWKILFPLLAPAFLYSWLWMVLLTYRELTVAVLLVSQRNVTLPVFVWGVWSGGSLTQAASVSVLLVLLMSPLVILYFALGRRRLALGF